MAAVVISHPWYLGRCLVWAGEAWRRDLSVVLERGRRREPSVWAQEVGIRVDVGDSVLQCSSDGSLLCQRVVRSC